jgi:hypothetical protein
MRNDDGIRLLRFPFFDLYYRHYAGTSRRDAIYRVSANRVLSFGGDAIMERDKEARREEETRGGDARRRREEETRGGDAINRVSTVLCGKTKNCPAKNQTDAECR